jgi:ABC-2 type transport system ATP-binding protein
MSDTISIQAQAMSVVKDHARILHELNFTVKSHSITGLIGPSGSGKTTLMRAIVGVQNVSEGDLMILGSKAGVKNLRRKIGYMAQTPAIYGDLTVLQNIKYFAKLINADNHLIAALISAVELTDHQHQLVDKLSGGQKTRVSLAIALLGNPEILILDEPTVGLDPVLRRDLWRLFKKLAMQGKTLIISSHVMDEAEKCDDLLLLRDGKLLWSGDKKALLDTVKESTVEDAFLHMIDQRGKR